MQPFSIVYEVSSKSNVCSNLMLKVLVRISKGFVKALVFGRKKYSVNFLFLPIILFHIGCLSGRTYEGISCQRRVSRVNSRDLSDNPAVTAQLLLWISKLKQVVVLITAERKNTFAKLCENLMVSYGCAWSLVNSLCYLKVCTK